MRYFSAFTGVGGFDLGVPREWQCVGMSEIDKYANMVLRYRFKDVKNYGNIEKIKYDELPDFEVLIGGSPCQDVSVAGKREGLAGSRSRLFYSYVEILKVKQPDYFIFENVKGLLSSNGGWDFAEVTNQFSEAGYDIQWQVLDAVDFGIPQHRERILILGNLRERSTRKVFFEQKNKNQNTKIQGQQSNTIRSLYRQNGSNGSYVIESKFNEEIETLYPHTTQSYRIYGVNGISPTLRRKTVKIGIKDTQEPKEIETLHYHTSQAYRVYGMNGVSPTLQRKTGGYNVVKIGIKDTEKSSKQSDDTINNMNVRYLTPLECERLMGWEDNWTKYGINEKGEMVELSDNCRYNLIGNGVVPQIVREIIKKEMVE